MTVEAVERVCVDCGRPVPRGSHPTRKYCGSEECTRARWRRQRAAILATPVEQRGSLSRERQCIECGAPFFPTSGVSGLCGRAECSRNRQKKYSDRYRAKPETQERERLYGQQHRARPEEKERRRYYHRARKYALTREQYELLFDSQGRRCAVCGQTNPAWWAVDHDHACCDADITCGRCVRGILCNLCNTAEGVARISGENLGLATIDVLDRLAGYLAEVAS